MPIVRIIESNVIVVPVELRFVGGGVGASVEAGCAPRCLTRPPIEDDDRNGQARIVNR